MLKVLSNVVEHFIVCLYMHHILVTPSVTINTGRYCQSLPIYISSFIMHSYVLRLELPAQSMAYTGTATVLHI